MTAAASSEKKEQLKAKIRSAFSDVQYPGDRWLKGSSLGEEPFRMEKEFKGKKNWQSLDARFLDQSPGGLGSALSDFSDAAFRFYLPAYLLADIDGLLEKSNPLYHLTRGFDDESKDEKINPKGCGERTWLDYARYRMSIFDKKQVAAIVAYLKFKALNDEYERKTIEQALKNYWHNRE